MKNFKLLSFLLALLVFGCDQDEVFDEAEQLAVDIKLIEDFLAENNIQADTLKPSEIRIVVHEQGTGANPQFGETAIVHYTGYLLDGTEFDTSLAAGRGPFNFVIGRGDVIQGWDIAVREMQEGTRATIYIPSSLAYGNVRQPSIPPNSVLIFDIVLLDIR